MGASDSTLLGAQENRGRNEITTISHRSEVVDSVLENLKSLKVSTPILKSPPTESSLTDILVRKALSNSSSNTVDPQILLELFSIYREWHESKAQEIIKRQEDIENKIEVADALATKLLQRFNHSVSAMRTTSQHLSQVHGLQVELGELKGRLTEVISNCDTLCKRITLEGPESLRATVTPLAAASSDPINGVGRIKVAAWRPCNQRRRALSPSWLARDLRPPSSSPAARTQLEVSTQVFPLLCLRLLSGYPPPLA